MALGINENAPIMELSPPFTLDQFSNSDGKMVCSLNWSAQFTIAQIVKRMSVAIRKNCFSEGISNYEALEMALACYHITPEEFLVDCCEDY